ncbi:hypothetical protein NQZ68_003415 [Dissostichus eleginoides]|nr:hypothetical protein NQZ68_003415 [Dissostichus eleginoides]
MRSGSVVMWRLQSSPLETGFQQGHAFRHGWSERSAGQMRGEGLTLPFKSLSPAPLTARIDLPPAALHSGTGPPMNVIITLPNPLPPQKNRNIYRSSLGSEVNLVMDCQMRPDSPIPSRPIIREFLSTGTWCISAPSSAFSGATSKEPSGEEGEDM